MISSLANYLVMGIVLLVFYLMQLLFAGYMTRRFLILQKKAKIMFVAVFYTFTIIATTARIVNVVAIVFVEFNWQDCQDWLKSEEPLLDYDKFPQFARHQWIALYSDQIAFRSKVILELFQTGQFAELAVQVKLSAAKLTTDVARKRMFNIRVALAVFIPLFVTVGIFDTVI